MYGNVNNSEVKNKCRMLLFCRTLKWQSEPNWNSGWVWFPLSLYMERCQSVHVSRLAFIVGCQVATWFANWIWTTLVRHQNGADGSTRNWTFRYCYVSSFRVGARGSDLEGTRSYRLPPAFLFFFLYAATPSLTTLTHSFLVNSSAVLLDILPKPKPHLKPSMMLYWVPHQFLRTV